MLTKLLSEQICDLVRQKPRTVQEIAQCIHKNWRTADRYVAQIAQETGLLSCRTFREGSRGALKVVYWNALDHGKGTAYQERLLQRIILGHKKEDFSPFDIYQFVDPRKRAAFLETTEFSRQKEIKYDELIAHAKHQILFFSGNLSWVELGPNMHVVLDSLAKKGVSINVITRIDITSQQNTEEMLLLNQRAGKDIVKIRHCEQPLRAIIIDDACVCIKEVLSPQYIRELTTKKYIFYLIKDPIWVNWLQKVFWHLWAQSIDAQERITALHSIAEEGKRKS